MRPARAVEQVKTRMEDGGWKMEDGRWRTENGGWKMEKGGDGVAWPGEDSDGLRAGETPKGITPALHHSITPALHHSKIPPQLRWIKVD